MKKIILFVASILAAIQSFANRNVNGTNSNSLILFPSDGIYNHGSHGSHCSHASHFSQISGSIIERDIKRDKIIVEKDSVRNVSQKNRESIIHYLAIMYECDDKDIDIMGLYISKNNGIAIQRREENPILRYKPNPNEECLYISFRWHGAGYSFIDYEYLIPLSDNALYHYVSGMHYYETLKEKWMVDFANKNK